MVIFLLIVIAAGLVLAAQVTEQMRYGIAALIISLASVSVLAVQTWRDRRRRGRETATAQASSARDDVTHEESTGEERQAELGQREVAGTGGDSSHHRGEAHIDEGPHPAELPGAAGELVRVVVGRKRFHEPDCASLAGRQSEELTREEAEEEGFTPCSICFSSSRKIRKVG